MLWRAATHPMGRVTYISEEEHREHETRRTGIRHRYHARHRSGIPGRPAHRLGRLRQRSLVVTSF